MKKLQQLFRNSYTGENIIIKAESESLSWKYQKEYIDKDLNNNRTDQQAIVIGNGIDRTSFDLNIIKNHLGTRLGIKILQTYGCNALYRDFTPTFLIVTGSTIAEEIPLEYCQNNIVLAPTSIALKYSEKFRLIPQNPNFNAGAIAAYLAAFDGHSRIFLLGFDGNDDPAVNTNVYAGTNGYLDYKQGQNDLFWTECLIEVIKTYPLVDWILVKSTGRGYIPEKLKYLNLRVISFNDFIPMADL